MYCSQKWFKNLFNSFHHTNIFNLKLILQIMPEIKPINKIIEEISPYYQKKGKPEEVHTIVYDSSTETLEPIYFFINDLLTDFGLAPEKLVDNFVSSPGSGHFGELGQRMTIMQQQGSKILGDINTVLRSVLNIIYDLKEFKIRIQTYQDYESKNKDVVEGALLSLKQIWMDKVDIQKGNSSIKAMALGQGGFQTLLDAFLIVKDESLKGSDGKELDLNDRVKRILQQRIQEFNSWLKHSKQELEKRYELEKNYLRSQVNSLKLYSRWAKPYLKVAQELEAGEKIRNPNLIKTFNTILLELTLLGKSKLNVRDLAVNSKLPKDFKSLKVKRDYYSCILVDFNFRGIPQRVSQGSQGHYAFGGKVEVTFRAYALNSDEIKKLDQELNKSDISDVLKLIEGATSESLDRLSEEINYFLEEKEKKKEKVEEKSEDSSNPFAALFGFYNKKEKSEKKEEKKKEEILEIKPDDWIEKTHLRTFAAETSKETVFTLFDIYKKAHGMSSYT